MNKLIDNTSTYGVYGQPITRISADRDGNVTVEEIDPRDVYIEPEPVTEDLLPYILRELIYWPCAAILMGLVVYGLYQFLICGNCP